MDQNKILAAGRQFRKLEDLDLIDNFLFQEMLSQEGGEEFARILLSTILGKEIRRVRVTPQKNILGADTDRHGVRLDAYQLNTRLAEAGRLTDIIKAAGDKTYQESLFVEFNL